MRRKLSPKEAKRLLARVPKSHSFWLCTSDYLRSLEALAGSLLKVGDEVFRYHVNRDKNDFERWIRDVVGDKELAREISRIKTKETLVRKISERVAELQKSARKAYVPKQVKKSVRVRKRQAGIRKRVAKKKQILVKVRRRRRYLP